MRIRNALLAVAGAAALTVGMTLPAMAAQTPGPTSSVTGTITVTTALTMSTTVSNFSLAYNDQSTPEGSGSFTVTTNDGAGYFVQIQGPPQFGSAPGIATSDVLYSLDGNTWTALPTAASTIYSKGTASAPAGDSYNFAGFVIGPVIPNVAPGSYPGTINFTSWAN